MGTKAQEWRLGWLWTKFRKEQSLARESSGGGGPHTSSTPPPDVDSVTVPVPRWWTPPPARPRGLHLAPRAAGHLPGSQQPLLILWEPVQCPVLSQHGECPARNYLGLISYCFQKSYFHFNNGVQVASFQNICEGQKSRAAPCSAV